MNNYEIPPTRKKPVQTPDIYDPKGYIHHDPIPHHDDKLFPKLTHTSTRDNNS